MCTKTYDSDLQLQTMLKRLQEHVASPWDWIVVADSDEFQDYGQGFLDIHNFVADLHKHDYNAAQGVLTDRLHEGGRLCDIKYSPTVWLQMPYTCDLRRATLIDGYPMKVMVFRNFLRVGLGSHTIVEPADRGFWDGSTPGQLHRFSWFGVPDLHELTPYSWFDGCYSYQHNNSVDELSGLFYFPNVKYAAGHRSVFHFKWHSGVIDSARARLAHYAGEASSGGKPRYEHYTASAKILETFQSGVVDISNCTCKLDELDKGNVRQDLEWQKHVFDHFEG